MPVKNGEKFLSRALTFLEQNSSCQDEIIVVNNGSTDGTLTILTDWKRGKDNVIIIDSKKFGLVNALNTGIQAATNNWIARFDVDDIYPETRIFETKKLLMNDVGCIFTDYKLSTQSGIDLGIIPTAIWPDQTYVSLVSSQRTAHPSACFNREAAILVGGYRQDDFPAEDISLWLRISKVSKVISIPKILLDYRVTPNSISYTNRYKANEISNRLIAEFKFEKKILDRCFEKLVETEDNYADEIYGGRRYLLHLRDLLLISTKTNLTNQDIAKELRKKIFTSFGNYFAMGSLALEKTKRMINRWN